MSAGKGSQTPGELVAAAKAHEEKCEYQEAHRLVQQAVRAVGRNGESSIENARALFMAAATNMLLHNHSQADELYRRARIMFESEGETDQALLAAARRVKCSIWMRDLKGAEHRLSRLEQELAEHAPLRVLGECESARGHIAFRRGRWEEAYNRFQAACTLFGDAGETHSRLLAMNGLAGVCCETGRYEEARALFNQALEGFKKESNLRRIWDIEVNLATLESYMGNFAASREGLRKCLEQAEKWIEPEYRGRVLFNLGIAELYLGEYRAARKSMLKATQAGESQNVRGDLGESQMYIALAELGLGNLSAAEEYVNSGEQLLEQSEGLLNHAASACRALIYAASGSSDLAGGCWDTIEFSEVQLQDDFWRILPYVAGSLLSGGACSCVDPGIAGGELLASIRKQLEELIQMDNRDSVAGAAAPA